MTEPLPERTEAARALEAPLARVYPCIVALRGAKAKPTAKVQESYREGMRLAAQELLHCYDSHAFAELRLAVPDLMAQFRDLTGAVMSLSQALTREADAPTLSVPNALAAWNKFIKNAAGVGVAIEEAPAGTKFDAHTHDAVAGTAGSDNSTVLETLSPGITVDESRVAWAKVRTGGKTPRKKAPRKKRAGTQSRGGRR